MPPSVGTDIPHTVDKREGNDSRDREEDTVRKIKGKNSADPSHGYATFLRTLCSSQTGKIEGEERQ